MLRVLFDASFCCLIDQSKLRMHIKRVLSTTTFRINSVRWVFFAFLTCAYIYITDCTRTNYDYFKFSQINETSRINRSSLLLITVFAPFFSLHIFYLHIFYLSDINDCLNHQCKNGGVCKDGLNTYTCSCLTNYVGARCEKGRFVVSNISTLMSYFSDHVLSVRTRLYKRASYMIFVEISTLKFLTDLAYRRMSTRVVLARGLFVLFRKNC